VGVSEVDKSLKDDTINKIVESGNDLHMTLCCELIRVAVCRVCAGQTGQVITQMCVGGASEELTGCVHELETRHQVPVAACAVRICKISVLLTACNRKSCGWSEV
jgi:hypothetical protein